MTPRVTTTGRDGFTPSRPQSEARRQHVHGPIQSLEEEACRLGPWSYAGLVFIGMLIAGAVIG